MTKFKAHVTQGNYANDSRYNIETAVVEQKDAILADCHNHEWAKVLDKLDVVLPVWVACDYAYKGHEIAQRVREGVDAETLALPCSPDRRPSNRRKRVYLDLLKERATHISFLFHNAPQYVR